MSRGLPLRRPRLFGCPATKAGTSRGPLSRNAGVVNRVLKATPPASAEPVSRCLPGRKGGLGTGSEVLAPPVLEPREKTPVQTPHSAFESADTVNRVVALLVRFPEIHSIRSNPADESVTLSYAVGSRLDRNAVNAFAEMVGDHVRAFLELRGEEAATLSVTAERDASVTFVHVARDFATFTREELELQIALFGERFGLSLLKNPAPEEPLDDDAASRDELVEAALDALRDPAQRKRLVGFREEKRVLVYFVHSGKGAKARARS